jgi:hypothetical protein
MKPGDKVVCIKKDTWVYSSSRNIIPDTYFPKFNEVVTIKHYQFGSLVHVVLMEYDAHQKHGLYRGFHVKNFAPLITDEELYKELSQIETKVAI